MRTIPSPHFQPIPLTGHFNADRSTLSGGLALTSDSSSDWSAASFGEHVFSGIPFALGAAGMPNVIVLEPGSRDVRIELGGIPASYLVFLHAVEDRPISEPDGFAPLGKVPNGGGMD